MEKQKIVIKNQSINFSTITKGDDIAFCNLI